MASKPSKKSDWSWSSTISSSITTTAIATAYIYSRRWNTKAIRLDTIIASWDLTWECRGRG